MKICEVSRHLGSLLDWKTIGFCLSGLLLLGTLEPASAQSKSSRTSALPPNTTKSAAVRVAPSYNDKTSKRYDLTARASQIDPRAKEHPEIGFVFNKDGKPQDVQHAVVDTRVKPRGKLVIWLMGHNQGLFERISGYGLHGIQVHYANGWFGKLNKEPPPDELYLGRIRLEAATGEDFSPDIDIPLPDGMAERSRQFVKWLAKENPQGKWEQFLTEEGDLRWEDVIMSGISHGSTTAARFAVHQKVDRVVMFSGPRDQLEGWYKLPSATPHERFFGFTHVLDGGWTADHYCRSWLLLGLNDFGPIVNVDEAKPPFSNTRRLVTNANVGNDANKAHGASVPGGPSPKNSKGVYLYEDVWKYLFTHPVDSKGPAVPAEADCTLEHKVKGKK